MTAPAAFGFTELYFWNLMNCVTCALMISATFAGLVWIAPTGLPLYLAAVGRGDEFPHRGRPLPLGLFSEATPRIMA